MKLYVIRAISGSVITSMVVTPVLLAGLWYLVELNEPASHLILAISIILYVVTCILYLLFISDPSGLRETIEKDAKEGSNLSYYTVFMPTLLCSAFILCSYTTWQIWQSKVYVNGTDSMLDWGIYLIDNLIRGCCLDFAETFYIDISKIQHTRNILISTFVFSFRSVVSLSLLRVVIEAGKRMRKEP